MSTTSTINVPSMTALLLSDFGVEVMENLLQEAPGGITQLPPLPGIHPYFTYNSEGDMAIVTDERRALIEEAIGAKLEERIYPGYELETALAVPERCRFDVLGFLNAWKSQVEIPRQD